MRRGVARGRLRDNRSCWIVSEVSKPVRGVSGNVDGAELRADLPEDPVWECEGITVYMTHIGGYPGNYDRRAGKEVRHLRPGFVYLRALFTS
jgi:hypothetical protein